MPDLPEKPATSAALKRARAQIARVRQAGKSVDRLTLVAGRHGNTLRGLAKAAAARVGRNVHVSVIANARSGRRAIPEDVADVIAELTDGDFPAIPKNWPGGIKPPPVAAEPPPAAAA